MVLEIDVPKLIVSTENTSRETLRQVAADAEESLIAGKDVLVMTSRKLITGDNGLSSLVIGKKVAEALVSVLKQIKVRPRFLITKVCVTIGFLYALSRECIQESTSYQSCTSLTSPPFITCS